MPIQLQNTKSTLELEVERLRAETVRLTSEIAEARAARKRKVGEAAKTNLAAK